ncbi:hypothetical protein EDB89DRAFT_481110 [Lactarius sanguifluus]|nr:hypothetical protein EDB89DRAFT_481110 [Lactarius sanguifluus]
MTCSSSLNPFTKSLCDRRKLTNYFLSNFARNIRRSHPTITHTDPANHDELSPYLLGRYRHHAFSLLPDIPTNVKRGRFHGAVALILGTAWNAYNDSRISTLSTALPPSRPVTCSETEPISKISPQQTQWQLLPPAPHPLASDSAYRNEIIFDPPDLGTCYSLAPCWSSICIFHDLSYSQFKAATDAISYPSPQSDGSVDQVFPSSPCDAVAPYLVLPLGLFMAAPRTATKEVRPNPRPRRHVWEYGVLRFNARVGNDSQDIRPTEYHHRPRPTGAS